jgi:ParB-like chromosome segregation protein Spo0J
MSATQQLEISQIDLRFSRLRAEDPQEQLRLYVSVQSEGGVREPLLVSTGVEESRWVLVDGFKRLRVAQKMGLTHLWVQTAQLDGAHAKAAMVHCNQPREGLSKLEEAWIVRSLCRDHSLMQIKVAELLKRDEAWVCRRLKLARDLHESLHEDVRQGALSATTACELSQLQQCNQQPVARAVIKHDLSSRECKQLLQRLRDTHDEQAAREVLEDPRRYLDPGGSTTCTRGTDPRLSKEGNRLRRALLSWPGVCGRLTEDLRRVPAADARILAPLIQEAVTAGARAVRQLEATHSSCSVHLPPAQREPDSASPAPRP